MFRSDKRTTRQDELSDEGFLLSVASDERHPWCIRDVPRLLPYGRELRLNDLTYEMTRSQCRISIISVDVRIEVDGFSIAKQIELSEVSQSIGEQYDPCFEHIKRGRPLPE